MGAPFGTLKDDCPSTKLGAGENDYDTADGCATHSRPPVTPLTVSGDQSPGFAPQRRSYAGQATHHSRSLLLHQPEPVPQEKRQPPDGQRDTSHDRVSE